MYFMHYVNTSLLTYNDKYSLYKQLFPSVAVSECINFVSIYVI